MAQSKLDSLVQLEANTKDSTEKLRLKLDIASRSSYRSLEQSMQYARESLELAQALENRLGEVKSLLQIAQIYLQLYNLGPSLEFALRAEQAAKRYGVNAQLGNVYNAIGSVHFTAERVDTALVYFEKSLAERRKDGGKGAIAGSLNNIGKLQVNQGKYDEARKNLKEALEINRETNHWRWEIFNLLNLGELERKAMRFDSARHYFELGLALAAKRKYDSAFYFLNDELARVESESGHPGKAMQILVAVADSADEHVYSGTMAAIYRSLSQLAKDKGDYRKSLDFLEKHREIRDSLNSVETADQLEATEISNRILAAEREKEFKNQQLALKNEAQLKRTQLLSFIILLALAVFVLLAILLYFRYRSKQRQNRELESLVEKRTRELRHANTELNTFIYQSSHDLRGPITSIQGLQQLMAMESAGSTRLVGMLGQKVSQLERGQRSLLHAMELRNHKSVAVNTALVPLCRKIIMQLSQRRNIGDFNFEVDLPEELSSKIDPWSVAIFMEHLLDNAVDFRREDQGAWCRISHSSSAAGLELIVEDNGIGMSNEVRKKAMNMFFKGSLNSQGSGLGLYNVKLALDLLGAKLSFEDRKGGGTLIRIHLASS